MDKLEIIVALGVWGNLCLQAHWYLWSRHIHDRKHFTDEEETNG